MPATLRMNRKRTGFTVTEIVVVVGIIIILASLIWPAFVSLRSRARKAQCADNLNQIYHGLAMYSLDNSRDGELFPYSMTNLASGDASGSYVSDERVFVCPMDFTKAGQAAGSATTLKPGKPLDTFSTSAERVGNTNPDFGYLLNQRNSSYKYEFSGTICETYVPDSDPDFSVWNGDRAGVCSFYLVSKADYLNAPLPNEVDRNGVVFKNSNGNITSIGVSYADFKFHQLNYGDIYVTGAGAPPTPPPYGFLDPIDYYSTNGIDFTEIVTSYSRSWLPVVRCFWHVNANHIDSPYFEEVQNIGLDGNVFYSEPYWERTAFKYGPKFGDVPQ